jgi:hypothetical protein
MRSAAWLAVGTGYAQCPIARTLSRRRFGGAELDRAGGISLGNMTHKSFSKTMGSSFREVKLPTADGGQWMAEFTQRACRAICGTISHYL